MFNRLHSSPLTRSPLRLAAFGLGLAIFNMLFGHYVVGRFAPNPYGTAIMGVLIFVTLVTPPISLLLLLLHYKHSTQSLERLVRLYVALILICANLDLDLMIHFGRDGVEPFKGMRPIWTVLPTGLTGLDWNHLWLTAIDCLHFSVATLSTVGYGDIYPATWYAKLAVDVQILMGLGITVLAVGRHFSSRPAAPN